MDELQISGKRFISAKRIARENSYTSDYVGQLIRAGKVTGQKVGRAWYVDAASFDAYLGVEAATLPVVEPEPEEEIAPAVEEAEAIQEPVKEDLILSAPIEVSEVIEKEPVVEATQIQEEAVSPDQQTIESAVIAETPIKIDKPRHVPLHIFKKDSESEEHVIGGLRYVADESSSVPEIASKKTVSRLAKQDTTEPIEAFEAVIRPNYSDSRAGLRVGALAAVAGIIFVVSAVVSSGIAQKLSITKGNSATAVYEFNW